MLSARLHALAGNSPLRLVEVDLVPLSVGNLAGARGGENQEFKATGGYRVPLSPAAVAVLRDMEKVRTSDFVFPGQRDGRPLWTDALRRLLERMGHGGLTSHGFRSTFRDWAAERTAFPGEVAEAALAHTVGNKVEAAYRRGDLFDKRRKLMEAWAAYCDQEPSGEVVQFRSGQ